MMTAGSQDYRYRWPHFQCPCLLASSSHNHYQGSGRDTLCVSVHVYLCMCVSARVYAHKRDLYVLSALLKTHHRQSWNQPSNHWGTPFDLYSYFESISYSIYPLLARESNVPVPRYIVLDTLWAHDG